MKTTAKLITLILIFIMLTTLAACGYDAPLSGKDDSYELEFTPPETAYTIEQPEYNDSAQPQDNGFQSQGNDSKTQEEPPSYGDNGDNEENSIATIVMPTSEEAERILEEHLVRYVSLFATVARWLDEYGYALLVTESGTVRLSPDQRPELFFAPILWWQDNQGFNSFIDRNGDIIERENVPFVVDSAIATDFFLFDVNNDGVPILIIHYEFYFGCFHSFSIIYRYAGGNFRATEPADSWGWYYRIRDNFGGLFRDADGRLIVRSTFSHSGRTCVEGGRFSFLNLENGFPEFETIITWSHWDDLEIDDMGFDTDIPISDFRYVNLITGEEFFSENPTARERQMFDDFFAGRAIPGMPNDAFTPIPRMDELEERLRVAVTNRLLG